MPHSPDKYSKGEEDHTVVSCPDLTVRPEHSNLCSTKSTEAPAVHREVWRGRPRDTPGLGNLVMDLVGAGGMAIQVDTQHEPVEGDGLRLADLQNLLPHLLGPVQNDHG